MQRACRPRPQGCRQVHEWPPDQDSWVFLIFALWGGLANYLGTVRRGHRVFSFLELIGELVVSGFSGTLVYAICQEYGISEWLSVALVGMGGHLGSRTVFIIERQIRRRLDATE